MSRSLLFSGGQWEEHEPESLQRKPQLWETAQLKTEQRFWIDQHTPQSQIKSGPVDF